MHHPKIQSGIYGILEGQEKSQLLEIAQNLIKAQSSAIQIRAKCLTKENRWDLAQTLHQQMADHAIKPLLIVNDDIELAEKLCCPIHLGQNDLPLAKVRKFLGKKWLIGYSTHSLSEALSAQELGADYIGFGPIYQTQSKKDALKPRDLKEFKRVLQKIKIPVVAIGGLNGKNIDPLINLGAKNFAFLSALHHPTFFEKTLPQIMEKINPK